MGSGSVQLAENSGGSRSVVFDETAHLLEGRSCGLQSVRHRLTAFHLKEPPVYRRIALEVALRQALAVA